VMRVISSSGYLCVITLHRNIRGIFLRHR
jgi:hypothetical protein